MNKKYLSTISLILGVICQNILSLFNLGKNTPPVFSKNVILLCQLIPPAPVILEDAYAHKHKKENPNFQAAWLEYQR
jgi:hypothetical protein